MVYIYVSDYQDISNDNNIELYFFFVPNYVEMNAATNIKCVCVSFF